jgi:GGDEF domain-containing protein
MPDKKTTLESLLRAEGLAQENRALKMRVHQLEEEIARLRMRQEMPAVILDRGDFVREVARMMAHDERYGGVSTLLVLSFEPLDKNRSLLAMKSSERVLQTTANTLVRYVRACDIVGRTGAEDFSILLSRCAIPDAERKALALTNKIQENLDPILKGRVVLQLNYTVSPLKSNPPKL